MAMVPSAYIANAINSFGDLINSKITKVLGITNEAKKLVNRLENVLDVLEDAERKKIKDGDVKQWLLELQEVVFESEKIIDYCIIEAHNSRRKEKQTQKQVATRPKLLASCFNKSGLRDEISKSIRTLNLKMKAILKEKARLNLQQIIINNRYMTTAPIQKFSQFLSSNTCIGATLETDAFYLVNTLIREAENEEEEASHPIMAIVGVGGIGKTTLARKIFNDERIRGSFDIRIWISLSSSLKDTTLLSKIIDAAGGNPGKSTTLAHLKSKLASTITRKRFFLVVDDVSDSSIWNNLLNDPLQAGARGSRILVTAGEENVAIQMGVSIVHDVKNLNPEEGWLLLREISSLEDEDESDILVEIGLNLSEQCNGLPLAIKTVGGILKTREPTIKNWLAVCESQTWSMEGLPDGTLPAFYLGYEDLSLNLKQCFMYCSLFPRNFCIDRHDLIKQWVSEGFIVKGDHSTHEETGEEYYRELVERHLIYPEPECDDTERCKMHDCLVNMARLLSADEILVDDINKLSEITFRPSHISLMSKGMENIPEEIKTKEKLRTLILAKNPLKDDIFRDAFTRLKQLRVLDISETLIEVIPDTLRNLLHLRYLNLSRTNIRELPESIGYLPFLKFLLLQECKRLHSLPKGIEHLKSLRNLDLSGTIIYQFLFRIGKLVNLSSLDFFIVNNTTEPEKENKGWPLGELKNLNKLRTLSILQIDKTREPDEAKEALLCTKPCLKELELSCSNEATPLENPLIIQNIEGIIDELCPPPCLETLKIMNYFGTRYPSWLSIDSLSNLQQLKLVGCQFCPTLPPLGQLPQLQFLYIANSSVLKDIGPNILGNGQEVAFPKLEKLHIQSLHKLESWTGLERPGTMPCLKAFQLESCPVIRFLPSCIRHSKSLKELRIIDCKSLAIIKNLTRIKELSVWNTPSLRKISNLTSLEDLNISHSPNLKIIKNVKSLKSVHIFDYDIEAIPRWVKTHAFHIQSLDLTCSEKMLQRCLVHGPDWDIIQDITHVYGHSNNCTYFLYKKSPFSFITNLSVTSSPQEISSTTETIIIETIDEEILESLSKEESLIINEIVTVAVDTRSKEPFTSRPLPFDTLNISMDPVSPPITVIRDDILVNMTQNTFGLSNFDTDTIGKRTDCLVKQKHRKNNITEVSIDANIYAEAEGSIPSNLAVDTRSKEDSTSRPLHLDTPNISINPVSPPVTVIRDNILVNMSVNTSGLSNFDTDTTNSLVRRRHRKSNITEVASVAADVNADTEGSMTSNLVVDMRSKEPSTLRPVLLDTPNISMNPISPPITVIRDNILVNMSENTSDLSNFDTDTISRSTSSLVKQRHRKSNITEVVSIAADINADTEGSMPSNLAVDMSSKEPSTSRPVHLDTPNISINPISPPIAVIRDNILVSMSENTSDLSNSDTDTISKSTSSLVRRRHRKSNITEVVSISADINADTEGSMPSNLAVDMRSKEPSTSRPVHLDTPNISMNPISPPIAVIRDNILVSMSENTSNLSNSDTDTISKSTSSLVRRRHRKSNIAKVVSNAANINNDGGSMPSNLSFYFDVGMPSDAAENAERSIKIGSHKLEKRSNQNASDPLPLNYNSLANTNLLSSRTETLCHQSLEKQVMEKSFASDLASYLFYDDPNLSTNEEKLVERTITINSRIEKLSDENSEKELSENTSLDFKLSSGLEIEPIKIQTLHNFDSTLNPLNHEGMIEKTNHIIATVEEITNVATDQVGLRQSYKIAEDYLVKQPIENASPPSVAVASSSTSEMVSTRKSEVNNKLMIKERLKDYLIAILLAVSVMQLFLIFWLVLWIMKEIKGSRS